MDVRKKNCCGCRKKETERKRLLRRTSLLATSLDVANEWRRRLLWALENKMFNDEEDPQKRKVLILLNPFGGAGAARRNWAVVQPMLDKAHLDYDLIQTQHQNHAFEIVNNQLVIGQFDVIVTVSGDGLVHEIINGLLNRKDWNTPGEVSETEQARFKDTLTLGIIPGGSGNGMVRSLLARSNENYGILEATFRIIKGNKCKIDLTEF